MRDQLLSNSDVEFFRIELKLNVSVIKEYIIVFFCSEQCIEDKKKNPQNVLINISFILHKILNRNISTFLINFFLQCNSL